MLITQLALAYSPDELAFYLVDLKEGVGFQDYVRLPHARVVALENERESGLNILRRMQEEIQACAEAPSRPRGKAWTTSATIAARQRI